MNRTLLSAALFAASLAAVCCLPAAAQDQGSWIAASSTAKDITGDLIISDSRVTIDFSGFAVAQIRGLNRNETSAVFPSEDSGGGTGSLYRLSVPAPKRFLHHNTLCGSEETQWMVTYVTGRSLQVAFFTGSKMPVFTSDAIGNSTDLCGTFSYSR
jgi:hypothetical protein